MRKIFFSLVFLFSATRATASFFEVSKPEEMVTCMRTYIINWVVAPATISSWEHQPAYEFAGKYFFASWHSTSPIDYYGQMDLMVGPNAEAPIHCDYPTDASGIPKREDGFCKAEIEKGDVYFNHTSYSKRGQQIESRKKIAKIIDSKIYCLNLARP